MSKRRWVARVLAVALVAVMLPLSASGRAWACSCVEFDAAESVARADAVFVGTVVGKAEAPSREGPIDAGENPVGYHVQVSGTFKGDPPADVSLYSPASQASCGLEPQFGARYLFFAKGSGSQFSANLCDGSGAETPAVLDAVAKILGPLRAIPVVAVSAQPRAGAPGTGEAAPDGLPSLGIVTLAVVAGLTAAVLAAALWRRRSSD